MNRLRATLRLGLMGLILGLTSAGWGFGIPKVPGVPDVPNVYLPGFDDILGALLKEEPPVSTSLEDALTPAPVMDGYEPRMFLNGLDLPREEDGSWILPSGAFEFNLESYCLHAGTHGPGTGEGYLLAPLKGSRAGVIATILNNTWRHPDLPQSDIQALIWAIEARTRLAQMPAEAREAARLLLSDEQRQQINTGTLFDKLGGNGAIPDNVLNKVMEKLPEPAKAPFRAQAKIHNLMVTGSPTFDQLEELAVLAGDPPPSPGVVPLGRWSWHPNRYFIRYFPSGYSRTRVQIIVPNQYTLERDALGRIISLTDADGWQVETTYADTEPFVVPGCPTVKGYEFRSIRFTSPDPEHPGQRRSYEIADTGWTFVGRPVTPRAAEQAALPGPMFANFEPGAVHFAKGWMDRAEEWKERYDDANEKYEKVKETKERWDNWNEHGDDSAVDDLTDIKHYEDGLDKALSEDPGGKLDWIFDHFGRVKRTWEWAADKLGGKDGDGGGDQGNGGKANKNSGKGKFGGGDVATPANRGRQRLGQSARGF